MNKFDVQPGNIIRVFACVSHDGVIRRKALRDGGTPQVYATLTSAKRYCRVGDAVVELTADLGVQQPLYINGQTIETE